MARPKQTPIVPSPKHHSNLGAGGCLAFLQQLEADAREPIQLAKESLEGILRARASRDARFDGKEDKEWEADIRAAETRLDIATTDHGKAAERLLKYEKAVAPEKRDDGERVTQKEAARIIALTFTHIRLGYQQSLLRSCSELMLCKTESDAIKFLSPMFDLSISSAIANAITEGSIPKFAADAITEAM